MGIVLAALTGIVVIALVIWLIAIGLAASADRRRQGQVEAEAAETQRLAERDRRMRSEGIQLRCLNCDHVFRGPLSDDGCPQCHHSSLVIPEVEYRQTADINRSGRAG